MRLTEQSLGRWVVVLAVCTVAGSAAELWLRPASGLLVTPLAVSIAALVMAFRIHLRNQASQRLHQQQLQRASELRMAMIEALALAIDARARPSQSRLRREQRLAGAIAQAFGLSPEEVEGVRTAALLHDVGHLGVPDQILAKRGPLTDEERAKMQVHAEIGAAIIGNVPFPYPVASLVRCHHERWDGTGYPSQLRGSEIPLGARILAVVDSLAALGADRGLVDQDAPPGEAVNALWQEAGKALDPAVVARCVELLPTLDDGPASVVRPLSDGGSLPAADRSERERRHPEAALADIAVANKELHALYEIAEAVGSSLGVTDSMNAIASKLKTVIPFSTCALFLYDGADSVARCRFVVGTGADAFEGLAVGVGAGLVGAAMARRECLTSGSAAADDGPARPSVPVDQLQSALVCPLSVGDSMLGALALYHTGPDYFTDDHRRLALCVSDQVAAVIYNSLVFERTQEESVTDALTGLPNTRFLFPHLSRELARARRLGSPMSVFLLDLDNLKHINDTFGHSAGDRALCAVASVLRSIIRPYDICARYGGDEFVVLLSDCGADQAEAKRVELQRGIDGYSFSVGEILRARLSVSVGAAVFPADGDTYDALLSEADRRMYLDKADRKRLVH